MGWIGRSLIRTSTPPIDCLFARWLVSHPDVVGYHQEEIHENFHEEWMIRSDAVKLQRILKIEEVGLE